MSALALTNIALNAAVLSTALNSINAEIENWINGVTASADITLTGVMTAANFTASAGGAIEFRDAQLFIYSSANGQLDIVSDGIIQNNLQTALTATIASINILHTTSGTPATGIGSGILFETKTTAGNHVGMGIESVSTNVGSGTEAFDFVLKLMAGGATRAEVLRVTSAGNVTFTGSLSDGTATLNGSGAWSGITTLTMSGNLTVDTTTLFVDSSSNEVGIGTATPGAKLHVLASLGEQVRIGSNEARELQFIDSTTTSAGDTHAINARSSTGILLLQTNGSTGLMIDNSSRVGIGTITPNSNTKLHVLTSNSTEYTPTNAGNSQIGILTIENEDTGATLPYATISFRLDKNGGDGYLGFLAGSSGNEAAFVIGHDAVETFRILTDGQVGIGTDTPGAKLHIVDSLGEQVIIGSNASRELRIIDSTTTNAGDTHALNAVSSTGHLLLQTNSVTAILIDKDSNVTIDALYIDAAANFVGINQTSQVQDEALQVDRSDATTYSAATINGEIGLMVRNSDGSVNTTATIGFRTGSADHAFGVVGIGSNDGDFFWVCESVERMRLENDGTLHIGTHAAIGAETITGYITIKDIGGTSRKVAIVS